MKLKTEFIALLVLISVYTDACSEVICAIHCTYGNVLVNGCKTCDCIDPCRDFVCAHPEVCHSKPYNCSLNGICSANLTCVNICPVLECVSCPYGYLTNKNGCQSCTCIDPCKNYKCTDDKECIIEPISCRDNRPCGYKRSCVPKCKPLNCPLLNCRYGYEVDCYNCPTCKCKNPCKGVICKPYYYCTVQTIYCLIPPCPPPFPVCESYCGSKDLLYDDNGFPVTCSTRPCPRVICAIHCTYGNVLVNGCKTCDCIDPCRDFVCAHPKVCHSKPYNCSLNGICSANLTCVNICPVLECVSCPYGYLTNKNGCQSCSCIDPCKNYKCTDDKECIIEPISCRDNRPCGYKRSCVPKCKPLNCPLLNCRYGYEVDCYNCPTCKCKNPCKGVICKPYYYCTVQTIYCLIPPCSPPFPVCESYCGSKDLLYDDNGFPVTCSTRPCPRGHTCTAVTLNSRSYCCRNSANIQ
ncbi:hypothetical protein FQR65_LT10622 [Abscondita terminalis]|nr:hypothetical protein FQR65_LT10622 [Abscondita terminalis]